jgi:YhcN/YlaJ family sporulation lipoprotein
MGALFTGCAAGQENENNGPETQNQANRNNGNDMQARNVNYNNKNNNQTRMEVADEAADRVNELKEVNQANVIVTNRNAYVAVVLDEQPKGEIRKEVENKISDKVKSTDPDIENVFVSANPDFVDRMTDYGDKIQEGRPVQGLFEEFTEMTQRIFPNAR